MTKPLKRKDQYGQHEAFKRVSNKNNWILLVRSKMVMGIACVCFERFQDGDYFWRRLESMYQLYRNVTYTVYKCRWMIYIYIYRYTYLCVCFDGTWMYTNVFQLHIYWYTYIYIYIYMWRGALCFEVTIWMGFIYLSHTSNGALYVNLIMAVLINVLTLLSK